MVKFEYKNGKKFVAITPEGEEYLSKFELADYKVKIPKHWDGKWRMVVFDIQEKRRKQRDQLREVLNKIGFYKLQNSVWLYPYDCEELIQLIKTHMDLRKNILYMVVLEIENDSSVLAHFNLKHN